MNLPKLEIKKESERFNHYGIYLDGDKITSARALTLNLGVDEAPNVTLDVFVDPSTVETDPLTYVLTTDYRGKRYRLVEVDEND